MVKELYTVPDPDTNTTVPPAPPPPPPSVIPEGPGEFFPFAEMVLEPEIVETCIYTIPPPAPPGE